MDHLPGGLAGVVDAVLNGAGAPVNRPAKGEWGLALEDVGGWPLDVGLRVRDGLLAVQAEAVGPERVDPHRLLHRNRVGVLVRYAHSSAGAVHVQAELPAAGVDAEVLDRVLALVVEAAEWARAAAGGGARGA
jgi:hypothetical protein